MFKRLFLCLIVLFPVITTAQIKYHENTFVGGVSGDGVSCPLTTTPLTLSMPTGSTVIKALLFAGRHGNAVATTANLNGTNYTFNNTNQISPTFWSTYGASSGVHAIDVSATVNGSVNTYSLTVTPAPNPNAQTNNIYTDFYLYAEYTHPSLTGTTYSAIFIQATNFDSLVTYNMGLSHPINTSTDVGVALFGGYTINNTTDGSDVYAEGTYLGLLGEPVQNFKGEGAMGSFYYHNSVLTGIKDDNKNQQMMDKDAVSDLKGITNNGANTLNMEFVHSMGSATPRDNSMWAVFYVNGVACIKPKIDLGPDISTCNNQVTLDAGLSGQTYSWSNSATTQQTTVNTSGTYIVTVSDQYGCSINDTIDVVVNGPLTVSLGSDKTVCTSPFILNAGNPGATYSWSNGATTQTINVTSTGTYSVVVTDGQGCTNSDIINITFGTIPTVIPNNQTVCTNNLPATIDAGNAGATYSWSNGATTQTISVNTSGAYSVTVTNANGCSATGVSVISTNLVPTVFQNSPIQFTSCNGVGSGYLYAYAMGSTAPYTFSWSTGSTSQAPGPAEPVSGSIAISAPGTYSVVVTDVNGCTKLFTQTVAPANEYSYTTSTTTATCGANNGSATVTVSGGKSPFTYTWYPNTNYSATATGLAAGSYTVQVKDATGCTKNVIVNVSNTGGPIINVDSRTDASCYGLFDGEATVSASGGTPGYTYSWSNFYTTATTSFLGQGVYTVLVTDAAGCKSYDTLNIVAPPDIVLNTSTTPPTCATGGVALVAPTGGAGGTYTYSWSSGTETTSSVSGLNPATYTVQVTDNNGCTKSGTFTIGGVANVSVNVTTAAPGCIALGSASAAATGGTPPLSYTWTSGPETTSSVTGLVPGNYSVTVTDNNGCSTIQAFTISAAAPNTVAVSVVPTDPTCAIITGSATAIGSGGSPSYSYSWSYGGATGASITGLPAGGTYTVTTTDFNGCSKSATFSIGNAAPNTLNVTIAVVDPSNCLNPTGNASAVVSGGGSVYTYSWSSGSQTGSSVSGLASGNYSLLVTDENGCTISEPFTIANAPQNTLNVNIATVDPTSCANPTGSATANVTGGGSVYTYSWSSGSQTTANVTGIVSGSYTLLVTDENGCTFSSPFTIGAAPQNTLNVTVNVVDPISCSAPTGSASAVVTGGGNTYTYSWSSGTQTTSSISGIAPGTYTLMVADENSCTKSSAFTIGPAPASSFTVTVSTIDPVACVNPIGSAATSVNPSGTYTYSWSTGIQTTSSVTGIAPGTYSVIVTDNNNCSITETFTIGQAPSSSIVLTVTPTHPTTCVNPQGSATVLPSGSGSKYTYSWSSGTQTNSSATGLAPGTYTVSTTDNNGCTAQSTFTINASNVVITYSTSVNPPTCAQPFGDVTILNPSGATTYSYSWSPVSATASSVSGLAPGNYSVTVTGNNGCTGSSTVVVPSIVNSADVTAGVDLTIYEGDSISILIPIPGFYTWTPGTNISCTSCNDPTFYPDTTTTYIVTLTDVNGCSDSDTITIYVEEPCSGDLYVATAFSPNNDGVNDVIKVHGNCVYEFIFRIYNRWGEKVFETTDINQGWDGTYRGKPLDAGVFVYYIEGVLTFNRDQIVRKKGNLTLVR